MNAASFAASEVEGKKKTKHKKTKPSTWRVQSYDQCNALGYSNTEVLKAVQIYRNVANGEQTILFQAK